MIVCYTCTINNEEAAEGNVDETKENGNTEQDEQCVDIVECKKRLREAYETILMYEVPLDDLDRKLHRRIRMRLTDSRALLNNSKEQTDQSYFTSTINNITESSQAEGSRSSIAEDENAREKEIERKQTFEFDEESDNNVAPVGFRMNSLYHCLYKLVSNAILL
ncbi:hypothetical protein G6F36_014692 [Rhizopus arrhizus]|nr:hypothetical protein G6F36_014692 [Rhizopus arrhizus]